MPISNERNYILKPSTSHGDEVALAAMIAQNALDDYTVNDLINLCNVAIANKYNNVSNAEVNHVVTGTIGYATSKQH